MDKKFAKLCCLITIVIVGSCFFVVNKTIDFPMLFYSLKIIVPAGIVAYFCGLYMGKTLSASKVDTDILNLEVQQQFVDDLLLSPDEVLNRNSFGLQSVEQVAPAESENDTEQSINEAENG